ncbi:MAG: biotin/lipoate--protein ligase family protein [Paracoccaceae bacterium]
MSGSLSFPPLLSGDEVPVHVDPFVKAITQAMVEPEPGQVTYSLDAATMRAAMCFGPDRALQQALPGALFASLLGLNDALGALALPEVAVHFEWPAGVKVNGARCGRARVAASTGAPEAEPDWLIVGVEVPLMPLGARDRAMRRTRRRCGRKAVST